MTTTKMVAYVTTAIQLMAAQVVQQKIIAQQAHKDFTSIMEYANNASAQCPIAWNAQIAHFALSVQILTTWIRVPVFLAQWLIKIARLATKTHAYYVLVIIFSYQTPLAINAVDHKQVASAVKAKTYVHSAKQVSS